MTMDAVLLAGGGADPEDPLYAISAGKPKALVPIAGKPLAQWVVDALVASKAVDHLVIVGLDGGSGLSFPVGTRFVPDSGSLLGNVRSGAMAALDGGDPSRPILIVSSDIPALEPVMVDWLVAASMETNDDFYYCAIDRSIMEARFPGSGRSFVRFSDREVCGGDLTILRPSAFLDGGKLWQRLTEGRKSTFAMASAIGFDVVVLLFLHRLTLADAAHKACARLHIRGRVMECGYAEMGMDVDKPFQFAMVEADLLDRRKGGSPAGKPNQA